MEESNETHEKSKQSVHKVFLRQKSDLFIEKSHIEGPKEVIDKGDPNSNKIYEQV